jgi:hypothetical protein
VFAQVNTGPGLTEVHLMNQNVRNTDAVTFATVNTGQGAAEIYLMDQNIRTTDSPTFAQLTTGIGLTDVYLMNQNVRSQDAPQFSGVTSNGNMTVGDGTGPDTLSFNGTGAYLALPTAALTSAGQLRYNTSSQNLEYQNGSGTQVISTTANAILNQNTLQSGATFYVSSGTVSGNFTAGTLNTGIGSTEVYLMSQNLRGTDSPTFARVDTGLGSTEVYLMNQNVRSQDAVIFPTVDTGLGAAELYMMDQNVRAADSPTFAQVTTGIGLTEVYLMNQNVRATDNVTFGNATVSQIDSGVGLTEVYLMGQNVRSTDLVTFGGVTSSGNMSVGDGTGPDTLSFNGTGAYLALPQAALTTAGQVRYNSSSGNLEYQNASGVQTLTTSANVVLNQNTLQSGATFYVSSGTVSGNFTAGQVNTGPGLTEVQLMNQNVRTQDAVIFATINTGQGAAELYLMNQNVRNTDSPVFAQVNTGPGLTEVHLMNQNVRNTDAVTFATINTGQGAAEVYLMNQNVRSTDNVTFGTITGANVTSGADPGHTHTAGSVSGLGVGDFTSNAVSQWSNDAGYLTAANTILNQNTLQSGATFYVSSGTVSGNFVAGQLNTGIGLTELYLMNQNVRNTDTPTFAQLTTGIGSTEVYLMDQNVRAADSPAFAQVNTGLGLTDVYLMNQNVRGTDAVSFATINTGQGAAEVYLMDQNIRTTDSPTFGQLTTGIGQTDVYLMNQNVRSIDNVTFGTLALSGSLASTGALRTGSTTTSAYNRIGISSAPGASITGVEDLFVGGDIETAGTVFFGAGESYKVTASGQTTFGLVTLGNFQSNVASGNDTFWNQANWSGAFTAKIRFSSGTATAANTFVALSSANVTARGSFVTTSTPDLAEYIQADADVEAFDLVVVSDVGTGASGPGGETVKVSKSRRPYDEKIMGVISDGSSAFLIQSHMNDVDKEHPGQPLVLAGRFPVKVCLENGPVRRGDALTSSSKPGYAMRATEPGATVGIALEDFDGATGSEGKVLCYVDIGERNMAQALRELRQQSAGLERENEELRAKLDELGDLGGVKAELISLRQRLDRMERQSPKKQPRLTSFEGVK